VRKSLRKPEIARKIIPQGLKSLRENQKRRHFECGGSPLLQQGELDFKSSGKIVSSLKIRALALDFFRGQSKAHDHSRTLSRNAEALLPPAKAEGSHQARGVDLQLLLWFSRRL
jgi:hypothetical protein